MPSTLAAAIGCLDRVRKLVHQKCEKWLYRKAGFEPRFAVTARDCSQKVFTSLHRRFEVSISSAAPESTPAIKEPASSGLDFETKVFSAMSTRRILVRENFAGVLVIR